MPAWLRRRPLLAAFLAGGVGAVLLTTLALAVLLLAPGSWAGPQAASAETPEPTPRPQLRRLATATAAAPPLQGTPVGGAEGPGAADRPAPVPAADDSPAEEDLPVVQLMEPEALRLEAPQRVLVLLFVAPGCVECAVELPQLSALRELAPEDELQLVAVNINADIFPDEVVAGYAAAVGYPEVRWMQDRGGELARRFGVYSLGSTVILDRAGEKIFQDAGFTPFARLSEAVRTALDGPG